jgi:transposase
MQLLPPSIEEYVASDDPVRAYSAFVNLLDLDELGIIEDEHKVGNSEYYPKAMIKLLVYGCSYGLFSSRKLERATYHNLAFIWLMGGFPKDPPMAENPDHKTIARFRKNNRNALKNILKQCVRLCIDLNLIEGNTLFVDGTKIRANAAIHNTWTPERCEHYLKKVDQHIESILTECDTIDEQEQDHPSLVKLQGELKDKEHLKSRVQSVLKKLQAGGIESINTTDPDCVKVKGRQGIHAGYNGQIVVDEKHGLIVHSDVVNESNDVNQFAHQTCSERSESIDQANQTLGHNCTNACADAGYSDSQELKKIDDQHITVIVPSKKQAHNRPVKPFDKEQFRYDEPNDRYICPFTVNPFRMNPQGHPLNYTYLDKHRNHKVYQITDKSLCLNCPHFGLCTKAKYGRRIRRLVDEDLKLKLEHQYNLESSQAIYKLRKEKVELPFGHIKRNLGVTSFLLRGLEGVKAEMSLLASCFDVARMINILGVPFMVNHSW